MVLGAFTNATYVMMSILKKFLSAFQSNYMIE